MIYDIYIYIYIILLFLFDVFDVLLFDVSFCGSVETPILQKGVAGSPQEPVESPTAKLAHQIMWSPEGRRVGMAPVFADFFGVGMVP